MILERLCGQRSGDYPCEKRRVQIVVEVDLDPVPGWGHSADDYVNLLKSTLNSWVPHYHPTVEVAS